MSTILDPEGVRKVAERLSRATPGPWEVKREEPEFGVPYDAVVAAADGYSRSRCCEVYRWDAPTSRDADFIAHSWQDISNLLATLAAREEEIARLRRGIESVSCLIAESQGVAGLHLNGDVAPWSDLLPGGHFEAWLMDYEAALAPRGGESTASQKGCADE